MSCASRVRGAGPELRTNALQIVHPSLDRRVFQTVCVQTASVPFPSLTATTKLQVSALFASRESIAR